MKASLIVLTSIITGVFTDPASQASVPLPVSSYQGLFIPTQVEQHQEETQQSHRQRPESPSSTPIQVCPVSPPVDCRHPDCFGELPEHSTNPYRCTSRTSFPHGETHVLATLHDCRCCPTKSHEPDCEHESCAAIPETYTCTTELLLGCECSVWSKDEPEIFSGDIAIDPVTPDSTTPTDEVQFGSILGDQETSMFVSKEGSQGDSNEQQQRQQYEIRGSKQTNLERLAKYLWMHNKQNGRSESLDVSANMWIWNNV